MLADVKQLDNEPILIVKYVGDVTADDVREMFRLSAEIMGDADQTFYRINDIRDTDSNFTEMLDVVNIASTDMPGSSVDPRIQSSFVGTSTWLSFFRNAMSKPKFGARLMSAFDDMDDAIASIRIQIEQDEQSTLS